MYEFDEDQLSRIDVIDTEAERKKSLGNGIRNLLETILEWIAAADIYSDIVVLLQLLQTDYKGWVTITIFSVVAPFFACQTPLIMFLKERILREKSVRLNLMGQIMVSPFMILYMFVLDIIFIINSAVIEPIIYVIKVITFGRVDITCLNKLVERSYEFFFGM